MVRTKKNKRNKRNKKTKKRVYSLKDYKSGDGMLTMPGDQVYGTIYIQCLLITL